MSDTKKQDAVLTEFRRRPFKVIDMAAEIARLRDENAALRAAVERVRMAHKCGCPILRALEETP